MNTNFSEQRLEEFEDYCSYVGEQEDLLDTIYLAIIAANNDL